LKMLKRRSAGKYGKYRRPIRNQRRWRWLRWLAGAFVASMLLAGALSLVCRGLAQSAWFQVVDIDIEGNNRLSKEQVLELSGVDIHSNLVSLSCRRVRERLTGNAWVAAAEVTRHWPNRLQIRVRERAPVAILNREGQLFYLDRQGLAFAPVLPADDLDYPVISGAGRDWSDAPGASAVLAEAMQFLRYAGGGNPNLPSQNISEINIGDPDCLVLYLMSRPFPIRLGRGEMKSKYERLARVLSGLYRRKEFGSIAYIDTEYRDGQILVGLTGGHES
jgi:cell division septal protein FtsQ